MYHTIFATRSEPIARWVAEHLTRYLGTRGELGQLWVQQPTYTRAGWQVEYMAAGVGKLRAGLLGELRAAAAVLSNVVPVPDPE